MENVYNDVCVVIRCSSEMGSDEQRVTKGEHEDKRSIGVHGFKNRSRINQTISQ